MRVVTIDNGRCDGCGLCVKACHEGALVLRDGKAVLSDSTLCDGIGDCLPACPQNAISFHEIPDRIMADPMVQVGGPQWPIKLELVPVRNPMFDGKDLLIAADCTAFTYSGLLEDFCDDGVRIIACPKLGVVSAEKLRDIVANNDIRAVSVIRMEVPCCGPLASKVRTAIDGSGKDVPMTVRVLGRDGSIRD